MDVHRRVVHHDDTKEGPDPVGDDSMAVVESGVKNEAPWRVRMRILMHS